jgi:hypothetical protein
MKKKDCRVLDFILSVFIVPAMIVSIEFTLMLYCWIQFYFQLSSSIHTRSRSLFDNGISPVCQHYQPITPIQFNNFLLNKVKPNRETMYTHNNNKRARSLDISNLYGEWRVEKNETKSSDSNSYIDCKTFKNYDLEKFLPSHDPRQTFSFVFHLIHSLIFLFCHSFMNIKLLSYFLFKGSTLCNVIEC